LAGDIDCALGQLAGHLEVVSVAVAPISSALANAPSGPTAGLLVTAVLKEHG
jgi:hypothetical protein